jgi:hypothetical protein
LGPGCGDEIIKGKKMKKVLMLITVSFCVTLCVSINPAFSAMSNYELMQELKGIKKRVKVLEEELNKKDKEIRDLKAQAKKVEGPASEKSEAPESWTDKITIYGAIELDYSCADDSDIGDNTVNDSTSELDIGTAELGVEVAFHEYVTGNFVLKGENLGSEDDRIFWDEASITLKKEGFPFYFVGGHRGQPFGLFESHLINDPLTQDLYEIVRPGATLGFAPGFLGLDISGTVYKGEELMSHMLEGAYELNRDYTDDTGALPGWRPGGMSAEYAETDDVSSFIGNISISPIDAVTVVGFWDSEPGDCHRNETAGGAVHIEFWRLSLDGEYIFAVDRESDSADKIEHDESAWFAALAFQVIDPLEIAARYEAFDDDIAGKQDGHLEERYSLGFTFTLFEKDDFACNLMGEFRRSNYEVEVGNANGVDESLNEWFARLGIEF